MHLSYKTRQFYRRLFRLIWILLLVAVLALTCWVLWLRRFIVYTADGVVLDFTLSQQFSQGQTGQATENVFVPDIYFQQTQPSGPPVVEDTRFVGYYVTVDELLEELDTVLERILNLPEGTPVMLDVKGFWGYFYYTSTQGSSSHSFDMATMDAFFQAVNASGVYAIARLPAFRDYDFADKNNSCGLSTPYDYLWADADYGYWLDPANDRVLTRLVDICKELREMGFEEVAFYNFQFPDTDKIEYTGDRQAAIEKATNTLVTACAKEDFVVSFITTDVNFQLPEGNCRLYLQEVAAADVQTVLSQMDDSVVLRTVFFTTTNDTRFETCGVIRPLKMAD